jgi:hypothetical protein
VALVSTLLSDTSSPLRPYRLDIFGFQSSAEVRPYVIEQTLNHIYFLYTAVVFSGGGIVHSICQ